MCATLPSRLTRRDFWVKNYTPIKAANTTLPILLRESQGVSAKLTATYGAPASPTTQARLAHPMPLTIPRHLAPL